MKVIIQRTKKANVSIKGDIISSINKGLLILLGIGKEDNKQDIEWMCNKVSNLRIFDDDNGVMNLSVKDIDGDIIVVSQFTIMARTKKGNRPSYIDAAPENISKPIYEEFVSYLEKIIGKKVQTGQFGADMQVELINDGPVTIIMDSKEF